ncbi:hypothetical protein [uncultured Marivirga sp.]|tara:strand:- start:35234 stop:35839 length:606 start_codon:yes stop_codon:yes gene_type:complete
MRENTIRSIIHLDMDTFFVSVERLLDSSLNGKPVIVGGGHRVVVAACSYENRTHGVHSAMPMKSALSLCPEANVISGDMNNYSYYSKLVTEIIKSESPLFEKASVDKFYLDVSGMDRYFGCSEWVKELRKKIINESGLPISMGLSQNKMVSKVATGEAKPNNTRQILPGTEIQFLEPMPVHKIPMIGKKTSELLRSKDVKK